eukprot:NODE_2088_length_511_cov_615.777056_g1706_i0.p1 GENE.NODE_2088_length_511_cov_615.777056_g1706_i0~~NODE_2088_length_511_cov_615.777056_g1706_i0.p1  ORF type:complete len:75 (+),score=11.52 NODE_2088_length_511_cov_615.777056_g1706_i0:33-257(+)
MGERAMRQSYQEKEQGYIEQLQRVQHMESQHGGVSPPHTTRAAPPTPRATSPDVDEWVDVGMNTGKAKVTTPRR